MKRSIFFLAVVLCLSFSLHAKNNLVIFSPEGERFTVILNGLTQNLQPETNVKVVDLDQPVYKLRIIFKNTSYAPLDKNLSFPESGKEYVFKLASKKGKFKLVYMSEAVLDGQFDKASDQKIIYYKQAPKDTIITTTKTTTITTTTDLPENKNNNTNPTNTNTTNTNNTNTNNTTTGLSININENGVSVKETGVDVNASDKNTNVNTIDKTNTNTSVSADNSSRYIANGTMCSYGTISKELFIKLKYRIDQRSYITKMDFIKDTIRKNCMQAAQVAEIVKMFDYATDQLDIAKYSYQYTYDTKNYDLVLNALQQDYNKPKLLDFIGAVSGSNSNTNVNTTNNNTNKSTTTTTTTVTEKKVAATGATSTSTSGCYYPMSDTDFKSVKESIASKSFEESKLTIAQEVIKNKCLNTDQIKEIMGLFTFEETKLEFAKSAYDYAYDKQNYYKLNDAFTFENSITDLKDYIESGKK
ncbi:MAG: DUF4476 domain-containing protein [Cytophagaceae bacterium]|nr:DUF4476 domain-containing protein [Cytophagaceae bacterium]